MPRMSHPWLFWIPRLLGLLYAAFISLFAADVFSQDLGVWQTVLALGMHLVPTGIVLALLAVAWRWEQLGGALFIVAGLLYTMPALSRHHPDWALIVAGPLFMIGALFLAGRRVPWIL